MRSSATSVCSLGAGGLIVDDAAFEAWARTVEGAEVEQRIERALDEAATAHHPDAPGLAPVGIVCDCVAWLLTTALPEAWHLRIARFSGQASRALREGRCTVEARATARDLLERPLRELLTAIRAARASMRSEAA